MTNEQLIQRLDRIERKLSALMQEKKKGNWVKAPVITKATGWDKNQMRAARGNGYVQYKIEKRDGKRVFLYDIDSLHPVHLKTQTA